MPETLRRSIAVFMLCFVALNTLVTAGLLALSAAVDFQYDDAYDLHPLASVLPFEGFLLLLSIVAQSVCLLLAYSAWKGIRIEFGPRGIRVTRVFPWHRHGFVPAERIEALRTEEGILGRIFGYGDLIVLGKDGRTVRLPFIAEPERALERLRFAVPLGVAPGRELVLDTLLGQGEGPLLEFKSSLRWDCRQERVDRAVEFAAMKSVAGFLNAQGGVLLLGVADGGRVVGIERDLRSLPRKDIDGFENHFTQIFVSMIGSEFRHLASLGFVDEAGLTVAVVSVRPSSAPAYLRSGNDEYFFVRSGNATLPLRLSEAAAYLTQRQAARAGGGW